MGTRNDAHLAIHKAIEEAKAARLAEENRRRTNPVLIPLVLGIVCAALGYLFTHSVALAVMWMVFGAGGVMAMRAMRRLPPHGMRDD